MDKKTIARNFSRYAHSYDKHADVQRQVAVCLLSQFNGSAFERILELGCGTGNYTSILQERFKHAKIRAVDISKEMIKVARAKLKDNDIEFSVRDAERIGPREKYDLITSNACLQWFENLDKALSRYKNMLNKGGVISFSVFGQRTFYELNSVLKSVSPEASISVDGFTGRKDLEKILSGNFKKVMIKEIRLRQEFAHLKDLLTKIKYTGTRGEGLSEKIRFSRGILEELNKAYLKRFHKITATYQAFLCQAKIK